MDSNNSLAVLHREMCHAWDLFSFIRCMKHHQAYMKRLGVGEHSRDCFYRKGDSE